VEKSPQAPIFQIFLIRAMARTGHFSAILWVFGGFLQSASLAINPTARVQTPAPRLRCGRPPPICRSRLSHDVLPCGRDKPEAATLGAGGASVPGSAAVPAAGRGVSPRRTSCLIVSRGSRRSSGPKRLFRRDAETSTRDECAPRRAAAPPQRERDFNFGLRDNRFPRFLDLSFTFLGS